jgi:hypothetical protein
MLRILKGMGCVMIFRGRRNKKGAWWFCCEHYLLISKQFAILIICGLMPAAKANDRSPRFVSVPLNAHGSLNCEAPTVSPTLVEGTDLPIISRL